MGFSLSTMFASGLSNKLNFVYQVEENDFCSGYSWLAEQVDLTGSRGGVVFLGANFGWLIFPPIGLHSAAQDKI